MLNPQFCLYCQQDPTWLKDKETLKEKIRKRDNLIQEQDQQIKYLKEINYNLRKKGAYE